MTQRVLRIALMPLLAVLAFGVGSVEAQYDYGKYKYGSASTEEAAFFVDFEAMLANPRNTDAVVATTVGTTIPAVYSSIIPDWENEFAGRLTAGYRWGEGKKLFASFWSFTSEQTGSGNVSAGSDLFMTIGPPPLNGDGSATAYDITTEITASAFDIGFAKEHQPADSFSVEWSLSIRYANFEETQAGTYSGVDGYALPLVAAKRNEGEMIGGRAAVRARYFITDRISATASLGISALDGELTARSSLTQSGLTSPESFASLADDSRSGSTRDFDAALSWHGSSDKFRVSLGWEQSNWEGIAMDMMRDFPGSAVVLRDRNSVAFSAYKLGLFFQF